MGFFDILEEVIFGKKPRTTQTAQTTNARKSIDRDKDMENAGMKNEKRIEKKEMKDPEKDKRAKEWPNIKNEIFAKYQVQIEDDAKPIAEQLYGKSDSLSAFFVTDERAVRKRYIEGGDNAIEEYAKNLTEHAFVGSPITATFLRRLYALNKARQEGNVTDTEIDIDGFTPNAKIQYTIKDTDLDGQKIPARRKFSPRCEMTATMTEGFHVGPFVVYDELYFCTKDEMEQMITKGDMKGKGMGKSGDMRKDVMEREEGDMESSVGRRGRMENGMEICPHGTDKKLYCDKCQGDIIISPSRKKVIGICLDVTGSMQGRKIENAKMAVERVLERIPTDSNIDVAFTIFSSDISGNHADIIPYGTRFTQEIKDSALERISKLDANGGTPLYDTINYLLDKTWSVGALDKDKIFFPYTYLIIISDGAENQSNLRNLIYEGKRDKDAFFAKLRAYRDSGLITEIIPFAYGEGMAKDIQLVRDLQGISGKILVNETDPDRITDSLIGTVDSILYGSSNLKMMGIPVSGKKTSVKESSGMNSM